VLGAAIAVQRHIGNRPTAYSSPVSAMDFDYDSAPDRWRGIDRSTQMAGDVHEPVARRIADEGLMPVVDVGGGEGELVRHLPQGGRRR
jgi:hypothetical protein